jgi:hypothetical protein
METRNKGIRVDPSAPDLIPSPLFKREKLLMERAFLPNIEPKDKETCRKRVLRSFFLNCYEKQATSPAVRPTQGIKFWTWVKALNPDISRGEGRFKSMSYSFLDFLLGKETFRQALLLWVEEYEQTLTSSAEDEKTRVFLRFIRSTAAKKGEIELEIEKYLCTLPPFSPHTCISQGTLFTQSSPTHPGLYLTCYCINKACLQRDNRATVHLGRSGQYEITTFSQFCQCFVCSQFCKVTGITVASSRWLYQGEKGNGDRVISRQIATL